MKVMRQERDIILAQVPRGFIVQDMAEDGGKPEFSPNYAQAFGKYKLWVETKKELEENGKNEIPQEAKNDCCGA